MGDYTYLRLGEVVKCFIIALAVVVLFSVSAPCVQAGYQEGYDYDGDSAGDRWTWTLWAGVEAHYTNDPLKYRLAYHWDWRSAWGWPVCWTLGDLTLRIVGHATGSDPDYDIYAYYAGGSSPIIMGGTGGLYAACDTQAMSRFANLFGDWFCLEPYASVCAGLV